MEDIYQFPIFFECHGLLTEHRKTIERYFTIQRKSGGGDCGPLRLINNKVYTIAFRCEKDQQRVLQRGQHVVELVDGLLEFTVQGSLDPHPSPPLTTSTVNQDSTPQEEFATKKQDEVVEQQSEMKNRAQITGDPNTRKIVMLGKTGTGKSSLANSIFGEELFITSDSSSSETSQCKAQTRSVNGRSLTLIDTPGFFDTRQDKTQEDNLKSEILRCITECAPGPHAFLIVLKVERFIEQEQAVINKITEYFSEEALKYAVVVFTHGDQLNEGKKIEDFVNQNKALKDLVKKCGKRCHVIDNKYWNQNVQDQYRNNQFQVEQLLNTIDKMMLENQGRCYTNETLQAVQEKIKQEEERIRKSSGNMSGEEIRERARDSVFNRLLIITAGVATGALLGAICGAEKLSLMIYLLKTTVQVVANTGGRTASSGMILSVANSAEGLVVGGFIGYTAAKKANTPWEAAKMAGAAVKDDVMKTLFPPQQE